MHTSAAFAEKVRRTEVLEVKIVELEANTAVKTPIVDMADRNDSQGNTALPLLGSRRHTGCHWLLSTAVGTVVAVAAFLLAWLCQNLQGQ